MAIGRTAAELTAAIASERAAKLAEDEQWDRAIDRVSNTNLRRREGDSMDRFRTGDIDVRKLDANSMSAYRQGLTANDLARIQSGERVGTLQSNNIYNLGLDTNRTSAANVGRNATATENVAGFGAVASMFGAEKGAEAAARPYKQLTRAQQLAVDAFGPQALMPQDPTVRAVQAQAQADQQAAYRSAVQARLAQMDQQFNSDQNWLNPDDPTTNAINARMDEIVKQRKMDPKNRMSVYNEALSGVAADTVNQLYPQFRSQSMSQPVDPDQPAAPDRLEINQPQIMNGGGTNNLGATWLQTPTGQSYRITTIK
jgi:hypothetical protein